MRELKDRFLGWVDADLQGLVICDLLSVYPVRRPYFIKTHDCCGVYLLTGMVNTGAAVLESAELAMLTDQNRRIDLKNSFVGWSVSSI